MINNRHFGRLKRFRGTGITNIGRRRNSNQDRILILDECSFYLVSDGMGGAMYGEKSAKIICNLIEDKAREIYYDYTMSHDISQVKNAWEEEVKRLNRYLFRKGNSRGGLYYGATLCAVMILAPFVVWINVGDSRGYQVSSYRRKLIQVTDDHNLTGLAVKNGYMTMQEARNRGLSSSLYSYMGIHPEQLTSTIRINRIRKGEEILLCTDGLYGMVSEEHMLHIIKNHKNPKRVLKHLVKEANRQGGKDNISVIYIR